MANSRSTSPYISCFLLFVPYCLAAVTSDSSIPEQLLWAQGLREPISAFQAAVTSTSSISEQFFWTQGLPEPISELTATVTLASLSSTSDFSTAPTTTPDPSSCNATSISCPDCNDAYIIDSENTTYHIFCNNRLYSDSPYPVQRWLSAQGCLAECNKYSWCKGVTSWEEGNCQLARGQNVFPQYDEDHIALLQIPEGFVAPSPATVPSAFPTGDVPLPTPSFPAPSETPGTCNLREIECPYSRGETITDGFNATYTIRCNFQPMCGGFATVEGRQSKCSCLAHCDRDVKCLAALFNRGKCDLCHGSLEGLSTYTSPRNYIVFVSEAPEVETSTLKTTPSFTGTSTSRPRLTPTSISVAGSTASVRRQTSTPSSTRPATNTMSSRRASRSTARPSSSRRTSTTTSSRRVSSGNLRLSAPSRFSTVSTSSRRASSTQQSPISARSSTRSQTSTTRHSTSTSTRSTTSAPTRPPTPSRFATTPISTRPPTSSHRSTSTSIPLITPSPIPLPQPQPQSQQPPLNPAQLPPISSAACPSWDNVNVYSPTNDRNYIIQCDASFDAALTNVTGAEDFAACASECGGECGGVVYSTYDTGGGADGGEDQDGGCTLYTAITAIQSQARATAGVWVRFPGTVPVELFTTTTTSSEPGLAASAMSAASSWVDVVPSRVAEAREGS